MNQTNNLFTGTPNADYLEHLKYPDAELKTWDDFTKAIGEKEFLKSKESSIYDKATRAERDVLTAHADEMLTITESIGAINVKIKQFIDNHAEELKANPSLDLGDIIIEAETLIKYKIKHKKESKTNGQN